MIPFLCSLAPERILSLVRTPRKVEFHAPEQAYGAWQNREVFLENLEKVEDVLKKLGEESGQEG